MRLYTHTDLDGVMCAVLISSVEEVDEFRFVDPGTVQAGKIQFTANDIISDLPYDRRAGMWFDHHASSMPKESAKFEGAWKLAPSAARVIFDYYENPYLEKYLGAVEATDKIDSGDVAREEAESPQGWFLFSNTLETSAETRLPDGNLSPNSWSLAKGVDDAYRRHVISLIRKNPEISAVLSDARVAERAKNVKDDLGKFAQILKESTVMVGKVAYSDMRKRPDLPRGNNYLIYSLFPDAVTSVRLMPEKEDSDKMKISVGHNIYHVPKCSFDVGAAMKKIGGGGHKPVGGASVKKEEADALAEKILREINSWLEEGKG